MKILTVVILCFASVALADDFKTISGKEYKNVRVSRIEPDGIVLISKSGISKVYFTELPMEVQDRFHYDAAQADCVLGGANCQSGGIPKPAGGTTTEIGRGKKQILERTRTSGKPGG